MGEFLEQTGRKGTKEKFKFFYSTYLFSVVYFAGYTSNLPPSNSVINFGYLILRISEGDIIKMFDKNSAATHNNRIL